ncbi:MAG: hypothetical protein ACRDSJ_06425 [Rubrobacteraceae bacterium]
MGEEFEEGAGVEGFGWDESEDLTDLSVEELRRHLEDFVERERKVSYQRRVLQGRIDLIRAELVRRGGVSLSPEELARVLMGEDRFREDPP